MKMLNSALLAGAAVLLLPSALAAQTAPVADSPTATVAPAAAVEAVLPANTEVVLSLNEQVASNSHQLGDKFALTVGQDVKVNGEVVIPHGSRAIGQVTYRTGKGSFGKSGKMDLTFRYIDLNGVKIPVEGRHHQEGEGNTAATVGAVFAAGVIGGLVVHGKSAKVMQGREFIVRTVDAIPVTVSGNGAPALIAASYTPSPVSMTVETDKERKARIKAEKASGKTHD
jgi:hypothetical protein